MKSETLRFAFYILHFAFFTLRLEISLSLKPGKDNPVEPVWIVLIVVVVVLLWIAVMYNALVRGRNTCDESWSDIDTELKRRYDLIPNLVNVVQGYAKHEREVLERVTQARAAAVASTGSPESQARDENDLVKSVRQLLVVVEKYPDLKASRNFLELQAELVNTEDRIQRARRFYNANVRDYNTRCEVFPSNLIAGSFGFQKREFFEIDAAVERAAPTVKLGG
jgi:LemA protein